MRRKLKLQMVIFRIKNNKMGSALLWTQRNNRYSLNVSWKHFITRSLLWLGTWIRYRLSSCYNRFAWLKIRRKCFRLGRAPGQVVHFSSFHMMIAFYWRQSVIRKRLLLKKPWTTTSIIWRTQTTSRCLLEFMVFSLSRALFSKASI